MQHAYFRRPHPTHEVARTVFHKHYIRVMRAGEWMEVVIDIWPLEGQVFPTVDAARTAAVDYIRELERLP